MNWWKRLSPIRPWYAGLSGAKLQGDLFAGLTNAAIVLPQGVAFSMIAGLPPQYGLYTAIVTSVIAAVWGSSTVMISGPTTAISAVMFASLSAIVPHGTSEYVIFALTLTIMVGALQLAAGLCKLGGLVSYVSHSVLTGFTAAAAVLIAASQVSGFLGIEVERGGSVIVRLENIIYAADSTNMTALVIASVSLFTVLLFQKFLPRAPGFLIALIFGAGAGVYLDASDHGVQFVGSIPSVLPTFNAPPFDLAAIGMLAPSALTIALVGLLEAISISRTFAIRRNEPFDSNQEIVGQGLSNFIGGFFQAYAGSGSFTRSGVNAESGAKSPMSAIFASAFLVMFLYLTSSMIEQVPIPAISGIILYVAWRLIDFPEIKHLIATSKSETAIFVGTMFVGLVTHLEFGIVVGVVSSLSLFLYQSAHPALAAVAPVQDNGNRRFRNVEVLDAEECPQISILRLNGTIYFGSTDHLEQELRRHERRKPNQRIKILYLKGTGGIDLAGADLLIKEVLSSRARGGDMHVVALFPPLVRNISKLKVVDILGEEHMHVSKQEAIAAAVVSADPEVCASCHTRIYFECCHKPYIGPSSGLGSMSSNGDRTAGQ